MQLSDAPLRAMPSVESPHSSSRRRGRLTAPSLEQCVPDGDQCRSNEEAEEAERDKAAEYAQDCQAQRHLYASADQQGLDEIVNYGNDEAPEDHENTPALVVLTKQPNRRASPDHDNQRRANLAKCKQ